MAESNEFFREVDEDYRRDQVAQIWKRYNALIIAFAVVVVAGVAGWRYWQHDQLVRAETASEQFDKATRLAKEGKGADADRAFASLSADGTAGYRVLARFRTAADLSKRDAVAAAAEYDRLAADGTIGDALRDLARLRAALLRLDAPDPAPALASLQGLAAPTGAFRHTAREMLGLSALNRGEFEAAGRWFDQINGDPDTPQGLRQRLDVYEALVSGGPAAVTQAKAPAPAEATPGSGLFEAMPDAGADEASPNEATPEAAPDAAAPPPPTR